MIISGRIRALREEKNLSQTEIQQRTGLLRPYLSRVENGHCVPGIETLVKLARAFECPLYQIFYDGEQPPHVPGQLKRKASSEAIWGSSGKDAQYLKKLRNLLNAASEKDRKLVLQMAQKMARR